MSAGFVSLFFVQWIKSVHGNCRSISCEIMRYRRNYILMRSVGITAFVGHLLIYLKKGQKNSSDGNNPFAVIEFLKIFFGIPFTGFTIGCRHKFSAVASVGENIDRMYLPLSQQISTKYILFIDTFSSDPEAVYLIFFQFTGLYRLIISLI